MPTVCSSVVPRASAAIAGEPSFGRVADVLRSNVDPASFDAWFQRLELESVVGGRATLSVPTLFLKSWLTTHHADTLLSACNAVWPDIESVEIVQRSVARVVPIRETVPVPRKVCVEPRLAPAADGPGSTLMPHMTFDSYVTDRLHMVALAAAKQVEPIASPEAQFNPLYFHGKSGVGKTHLMQAIAHANRARALYVTADHFMRGLLMRSHAQANDSLQTALVSADVILVDDLQLLFGKETHREFTNMVNRQLDSGKQLVVAALHPPQDLDHFDERVRSRLSQGLVIELPPPGEDTRRELLSRYVAERSKTSPGFSLPPEVLAHLASRILNPRSLEAAVRRLNTCFVLTNEPVTLSIAESETFDLVMSPTTRVVRMEDIQKIVARHYNVSRGDILSSRRTANVVRPRQVAMYLAKRLTLRSLPEIGRRFGGRDHTTVLHAVRRVEHLLPTDEVLQADVAFLTRELS